MNMDNRVRGIMKNLIVAVDDGFAQTKLFGEDENGKHVKAIFRSSIKSGRYGLVEISGTGAVGSYETDGVFFTVAESIETESTKFDGFHLSDFDRVLVNHALFNAGYGNKNVFLICGLPVDDYFLFDGNKNIEMIEKKKNNLKKEVLNSNKKPLANIKNIEVGSQALSAYMDYLLDFEGVADEEKADGSIAVVDIGGGTTDTCVIVDGQFVDRQRTGTSKIGMLDVYRNLGNLIKSNYKIHDNFTNKFLDKALRSKKITLMGEEIDLTSVVDEVISEFEGRVAREVEGKIGEGGNLSKVLFVGGGSNVLRRVPVRGAKIVEDPEFANARGLFKFAKMQGWS